jgi:hypothetical protein
MDNHDLADRENAAKSADTEVLTYSQIKDLATGLQSAKPEPTAEAINGELRVGDWVIVKPDEDYGSLVGQVTAIDKLGSPEHDTDNPGDDVHVDFTRVEYPESFRDEYAATVNKTHHRADSFDDLALDDVIMAPEMLISLVGRDIEVTDELTQSYADAREWANNLLSAQFNDHEAELIARVERNYADFKQSLDVFSRGELIEMAAAIHAYSDAWSYMTSYHAFSDEEIEFYLKFSNPLEIVGDAWRERNIDLEDMSYTMDFVCEQKDQHLAQYALVTDAPLSHDSGLRRYMNVDVLDFLGKIAEKTILHYPKDWQIDRETLYRATSSDDLNDRRLVWHVCSFGTHLNSERDVFVIGSWAHGAMTDYRQNEPDMFGYVVEVTGRGEKGEVLGNVYEVGDYAEYANHIRDEALPCDTVTLTYSEAWGANAGRVMTVSRAQYDADRHNLMSESGDVVNVRYNPAYESQLQDVLRAERNTRMSYPIGSPEAHLQKVTAKLAEIRKPPEQEKPTSVKEKSAFDKALSRGKEKSDAYKAQKAGEPAADKKKHEERS